jgi:hypothetical protein
MPSRAGALALASDARLGELPPFPLYRAAEPYGRAAGLQPRRHHGAGAMDGHEAKFPSRRARRRPIKVAQPYLLPGDLFSHLASRRRTGEFSPNPHPMLCAPHLCSPRTAPWGSRRTPE